MHSNTKQKLSRMFLSPNNRRQCTVGGAGAPQVEVEPAGALPRQRQRLRHSLAVAFAAAGSLPGGAPPHRAHYCSADSLLTRDAGGDPRQQQCQ